MDVDKEYIFTMGRLLQALLDGKGSTYLYCRGNCLAFAFGQWYVVQEGDSIGNAFYKGNSLNKAIDCLMAGRLV